MIIMMLNSSQNTLFENPFGFELNNQINKSNWFETNRTLLFRFIFIAIFSLLFCYKSIRNRINSIRLIDKIPGPPVNPYLPWLGHAYIVLALDRCNYKYGTYALIFQMVSSVNRIYSQEGICRMWIGLKPLVLLFRPNDVEIILSRNNLTEKSTEYRFLNSWLGEGLVTSGKQKWRLRRKILTPAFHFRIIEDFLPIINEQSDILIKKLDLIVQNGPKVIDVVSIITLCMLDIICETAMGSKLNLQANSNHEYVEALYNISRIFLIRLMRPWLWNDFIFNQTDYGHLFNRSVSETKKFTMKVIKKRRNQWIEFLSSNQNESGGNLKANNGNKNKLFERNNELSKKLSIHQKKFLPMIETKSADNSNAKRLAFLDLLLQHHLVTKKLTLEDLREEVDTFMFAGHDTTSHAISWILYMLGLHPDVQQKVWQEINSILPNKIDGDDDDDDDDDENYDITIEQIKQMKYLDCVIKEVLRIYPTAPFIGRDLTEDTDINGYLVPKGTTVGIFTYVLHRDPQIFPEPERFRPERFLPENCNGRHPFSFIPFSAGPRNCIGQKFAMNEIKIVTVKIVKRFRLRSIDERDRLVIVGEMILRSLNGIKILFEKRAIKQKKTH
ncbi:Cytochrome P450 4c3 [Sarcoptes scabiei]|uniref:Cytochrome P450 4c3 n=1 Tax=Sarcoptes scabiei TaxID=52283 RepID=A0A834RAS4_SARSC|nr:Cytochrome P450 4c3 [Sarcoptes scabiei]